MANSDSPRALAVEILSRINAQEASLASLLPEASARCAEKDRPLLQELCYGICRWQGFLDACYRPFLQTRINKKDQVARQLLRLGCYQLLFTRIPSHAAIFETVALAPQCGIPKLKGLINAVLRRVSEQEFVVNEDAAQLSHPEWMQAKIAHNWPEQARTVFWQNNQHPPLTLRINRQQSSREDYLTRLAEAEIAATACRFSPMGVTLEQGMDVTQLPGFAQGMVSVQDEAAQLCCEVLQPQAGERILDACAAPGGKTGALLEAEPDIQLEALDNDATRAQRISDNLTRLGYAIPIHIAPAEQLEQWWSGEPFDAILLDAPCSASGVIRRHPDIKQLRREGDIVPLASLQLGLLEQLWRTLKPGGRLVYATCSIFPQENSRIIQRFLKQQADASLKPIEAPWGLDTGFGRQCLPQPQGHDGFFYACLNKSTHALPST
ncbi:MAG: 16S rRNA (cytosine(967)-C(5))-methyltransferase RsmB [Oleiphilaceae bacterium]|nr:16S rRNA (cytosine(967)-C(5))-methyltransferase RsmB [Oleiphilaceae bacterium]